MFFNKQLKKFIQIIFSPIFFAVLVIYFRKLNLYILIMDPKGKLSQYVCYLEPELRKIEYLKKQQINLNPIIINPGAIPNKRLHEIYLRQNKIVNFYKKGFIKNVMLKLMYSLNYVGYKNVIILQNHLFADSNWLWNDLPSTINFTNDELFEGEELLKNMGISVKEKFILIHLREEHYYQNYVDKKRNPESSENFSIRNPMLSSYESSIRFLIKKGFKVIKTGFPGSKCNLELDGFIDYANNFRTEFGDIFLHAKAEFVISGASGNFHLASIFGTPSILTNSYHLEVIPMLNSDMSLPVIYKEKSSGNILCVSKMLSLGIELSSTDYLTKNEISLIPNSNEELLMAIKEMYENLYNKNFSFLPINEENKINKLFKKNHIAYKKQGKICRYWLQKYNHIIY